jgi:hypothetical protein
MVRTNLNAEQNKEKRKKKIPRPVISTAFMNCVKDFDSPSGSFHHGFK